MTNEGKQSTHKTIIKVSGAKHLKFLACRLVAHRVNGKVDKHSEADGIQEFEVTASAWSGAATIKEWEEAKAAAAAAAANPAPAEGDGMAAAEGDGMAAEGDKMEGDAGMMMEGAM